MRTDFHCHTTFCDGKNTPEEMVLAAIDKHLDILGFSGHSYTAFDDSYAMSLEGTRAYIKEIRRLQNCYADKIQILCGIEQDLYGDTRFLSEVDYAIGSVHYLKHENDYRPIDSDYETLANAVHEWYNDDWYAMAESYFDAVATVYDATKCRIIGHFDLITKFQEKHPAFDETHPRYRAAWKKCCDILLTKPILFEINTGAISRGHRTTPYPSMDIYRYLKDKGAQFILNSDSHSTTGLECQFSAYKSLATVFVL